MSSVIQRPSKATWLGSEERVRMEARGPACERLADAPRSPLPLALFPNVTNPRSGHSRAGSHGASHKERQSQEDHSLSSTECLGAQDTRRAVDGAEDGVQQRETAPDTEKAGKRLTMGHVPCPLARTTASFSAIITQCSTGRRWRGGRTGGRRRGLRETWGLSGARSSPPFTCSSPALSPMAVTLAAATVIADVT